MRFTVILSAVVIGISALVILHGGGSEAAWPGENGRIVYSNGGIWIMDADGSSRQPSGNSTCAHILAIHASRGCSRGMTVMSGMAIVECTASC